MKKPTFFQIHFSRRPIYHEKKSLLKYFCKYWFSSVGLFTATAFRVFNMLLLCESLWKWNMSSLILQMIHSLWIRIPNFHYLLFWYMIRKSEAVSKLFVLYFVAIIGRIYFLDFWYAKKNLKKFSANYKAADIIVWNN